MIGIAIAQFRIIYLVFGAFTGLIGFAIAFPLSNKDLSHSIIVTILAFFSLPIALSLIGAFIAIYSYFRHKLWDITITVSVVGVKLVIATQDVCTMISDSDIIRISNVLGYTFIECRQAGMFHVKSESIADNLPVQEWLKARQSNAW